MNKIIFLIFLLFSLGLNAQNITGTFPQLANQKVKLEGFDGFSTYAIDSTIVNKDGVFLLSYSKKDYGMGYLLGEDNTLFIVVLSREDMVLKGDNFTNPETIEIFKGTENRLFGQYANEHPRREQTLSAWVYLEKIYSTDSLFTLQQAPKEAIAKEKQRIKEEDNSFLNKLPKNSYVSWYLPVRKTVSSVSVIAQYRIEEIPATIAAFRSIDYTDLRLYKSGLLKDVIESHFWLIENSGRSLDSVFIEMQISINSILETLTKDEKKFNDISDFLFKLLERRSLFKASEYLALKVLNETACSIDNDLAKQLESYRAMKIGNTATDIVFSGDYIANSYSIINTPKKLSQIQSKYVLLVFGASWCQKCVEELNLLKQHYFAWRKQDIEVVFVSLDENKNAFRTFASIFPFISICDYKKWYTQAAIDYYVFATPTMYLLNNKREILLRPNSVKQMDAWVDWYLIQKKTQK